MLIRCDVQVDLVARVTEGLMVVLSALPRKRVPETAVETQPPTIPEIPLFEDERVA